MTRAKTPIFLIGSILLVCHPSSQVASDVCRAGESKLVVRNSETGVPVVKAMISASGVDSLSEVLTNEEGWACLPAPPISRQLLVEHTDFESDHFDYTGSDDREATILLAPLSTVELRILSSSEDVVDTDIAWISGTATVSSTTFRERWSGIVGKHGDPFNLAVMAEGFAAACIEIPKLAGGVTDIEVGLKRSGSIVVEVRDSSETRVEGVFLNWIPDKSRSVCLKELIHETRRPETIPVPEDATWVLTNLIPGLGVLEVSAPGYKRELIGPVLVQEGVQTPGGLVMLKPGMVVTGIVKNKKGNFLEGVSVVASDVAGDSTLGSASTSADGSFEIELRKEDFIDIHVGDPPGPVTRLTNIEPLQEPLSITLPEPATIQGMVRSTPETAIPDATVVASPLESLFEEILKTESRTITDGDGAFLLDDLSAGKWRVDVRKPGFSATVEVPVVLKEGTTKELEIYLDAGVFVEGRVLQENNLLPAPGARVSIESSIQVVSSTLSAEDGSFYLEGVSPGVVRIVAEHPQLGSGAVRVDPESGPVKIMLKSYGRIEGWALGPGHLPLANKRIQITGTGLTTYTDTQGWFAMDRVPAGKRRIVLLRYALPGSQGVDSRDVDVAPGETVVVEFTSGVSVSGIVLLNDRPLQDVLVTFTRMNEGRPSGNLTDAVATARTDLSGSYLIEELRGGTYTVSARKAGTAFFRTTDVLEGEENRVDLQIQGEVLQGRVIDSDTGSPVPEATITAFDPNRSFGILWNSWNEATDAIQTGQVAGEVNVAYPHHDGTFELFLPPGSYRLRTTAQEYQRLDWDVNVVEGRNEFVTLELRRGWGITGIVRNAWQNPISGAVITAACGAAMKTINTVADSEGVFRVKNLERESCTILAYTSGHGIGVIEAIPTDEQSFAEIILGPAGSIEIRFSTNPNESKSQPQLMTPLGFPLGALLSMAPLIDLRAVINADDDGHGTLSFPTVPIGEYLVVNPTTSETLPIFVGENEPVSVKISD